MNVENNTVAEAPVGEAAIVDVKYFYIDAEGNRVEVPRGDGEAAPEEAKSFFAEEDTGHVIVH